LNSILESNDDKCVRLATDAVHRFSKSVLHDHQSQSKQERSIYRGGSLLADGLHASETTKDASKINYAKNCFNMMKRLGGGGAAPPLPIKRKSHSHASSRDDEITMQEKKKKFKVVDFGAPRVF
jgi:hypothetical protein